MLEFKGDLYVTHIDYLRYMKDWFENDSVGFDKEATLKYVKTVTSSVIRPLRKDLPKYILVQEHIIQDELFTRDETRRSGWHTIYAYPTYVIIEYLTNYLDTHKFNDTLLTHSLDGEHKRIVIQLFIQMCREAHSLYQQDEYRKTKPTNLI